MAYLQERMVAYVTADPCLFVAEERLLEYGQDKVKNRDHWWVDALIVDPWHKMFYLGEATYNLRPDPLLKKLGVFATRKADVLRGIGRDGAPGGWDIRPWLFLREGAVEYLKPRLPAGLHPRITHLEKTSHPWDYEDDRKQGREPGRPYLGLEDHYQV